QIVHSRLVEQLRPDNPLTHAPWLTPPFSLTTPSGLAALNAEVTRQATMVAYINDFALMLMIVLLLIPLLLLVRRSSPVLREQPGWAPAMSGKPSNSRLPAARIPPRRSEGIFDIIAYYHR